MTEPRTSALRMYDPRSLPQMIVDLLHGGGEAMALEVADELGVPHKLVSVKLSHLKRQGRAHISGWCRTEERGRLRARALWSAGAAPDAAKMPPLTKRETNERHAQRVRLVVPSVFSLAAQRSARVAVTDWRRLGALGSKISSSKVKPTVDMLTNS